MRQRGRRVLLLIALCAAMTSASHARDARPPFWRAVSATGDHLGCLRGQPAAQVALIACEVGCEAIPWQLDERDAGGVLALENGAEPNPDDPPGVIDDNDEIWWMAEDAGRRIAPEEMPADVRCGVAWRLAADDYEAWVYAFAWAGLVPRATRSYVAYDPERDAIAGARVSVGFRGATPQYFALRPAADQGERNLLDRLKVRASARFLGIIPLRRDEDDFEVAFIAWRAGPIRAIRRQRQWIRLGWGLRTPIFRTDAFFYRDFSELPVHLRLNFPPTYFFRGIEIQGMLDFRDLRGWRVLAPGLAGPMLIGALGRADLAQLNQAPGDWFALLGPEVTLVQMLTTSRGLSTVRRRLVYREERKARPPEADRGEMPGVGYRLTDWSKVDRGRHWFTSTSYALPAGSDIERFLRERREEPSVELHPIGR